MPSRLGLASMVALAFVAASGVASPAHALPPGRSYEMVSPTFKGGFGALAVDGVSEDGERVTFYSPGAFAGAPSGPEGHDDYLARRGSAEWSTVPLMPPASLLVDGPIPDLSPSLREIFAMGLPGPNRENPSPEVNVLRHPTELPDALAGWQLVGKLEAIDGKPDFVQYRGANLGFCHALFTSDPLFQETVETIGQLYEFDAGCGGKPTALRLVGVDNAGNIMERRCAVDLGIEGEYATNGVDTFNAISRDGSEIFFTDCLGGESLGPKPETPHQLFVRLGGARTVEVSRPISSCGEVPCSDAGLRGSADFAGASEDGTRVFFTARLAAGQPPLVPGQTDASNHLYVADIGCPAEPGCEAAARAVTSLTDVSRDPNGQPAGVKGVVRIAPDGSRAYFVASGDLLSSSQQAALEAEGRSVPAAGADNLYAAQHLGGAEEWSISFIGALCSGPQASGAVRTPSCPSATGSDQAIWSTNESEAQTGGIDGRFLVFSTFAQLTADDTNAAKDVYRYDAQTGTLQRASIGEGGYDANGNGGVLGSEIAAGHRGFASYGAGVRAQYELDNRAIGEDGSRIVFTSSEPLSPLASNGLMNAYEWHEGRVSLVSTGSAEAPVEDVTISPNGLSVVFVTVQGLVPQDTDGAPDVYDARLEGGFPQAPAGRMPCESDACQGPFNDPASLPIPGSVVEPSGGNWPQTVSTHKAAKKAHAKRRRRRKHPKRKARRSAAAKPARRGQG